MSDLVSLTERREKLMEECRIVSVQLQKKFCQIKLGQYRDLRRAIDKIESKIGGLRGCN